MIDFTEAQVDTASAYGGSDQKRGVIYDGKRYMLKLSDRIQTEKRNDLNSSYSNSVYSEYICCHILNALGFQAQNTLLGTLTQVSRKGYIKETPVVACENFIPEGCQLVEFKNIENALLLHNPPKVPELNDIYEVFSHENAFFLEEKGEEYLKNYWDCFIMDAFFGNFDRHANNWGYLVDKQTKELRPAPIYDCGSCLYPQLADDALEAVMKNEAEVERRLFGFPNACLAIHGSKVGYFDYLNSMENQDCTDALLRIYPCINMEIVQNVIENTPGISELRKMFYITMLQNRMDKILTPVYEKALSLTLQKEESDREY